MSLKKSRVLTMNLTEIVDVQCEIIKIQSKLIKDMAIEIDQKNIFEEEMERINRLKEKIKAQNE